jgi:hypothetical protein
MAATSTAPNSSLETLNSGVALIVSLPPLAREAFDQALSHVNLALNGESILVASPDTTAAANPDSLPLITYTPPATAPGAWTLVAADFLNAHELLRSHQARSILILGPEAQSLEPSAIRALAEPLLHSTTDLALARYHLPPRTGLVNSAILYPISRALFGASPRFPLAIDLGLSARMAERMAAAAQPFTAANQPDALLWPVSEAATGGCNMVQIDIDKRTLPQPPGEDLNFLLAQVTASLFADVDRKASFWQRVRVAPATRPALPSPTPPDNRDELRPMQDAFRLAYTNLLEIWSLVLPPQSLLGLKRLSVAHTEAFLLPDPLWARIVYDFLLAFRLRTINRSHLLGALTPLYLAWVASHILLTSNGTDPERHIETVASTFESEKPYLVSRWRWPDRFNP